MGLMLMGLQGHSQNISKVNKKERVSVVKDSFGGSNIVLSYKDAKILLRDVLEKKYADSLLIVYKRKDTLNTKTITLQEDMIRKLINKNSNYVSKVDNLNVVVKNKNKEIEIINENLRLQIKETRRQKRLKVFGFISAGILPIATILLIK